MRGRRAVESKTARELGNGKGNLRTRQEERAKAENLNGEKMVSHPILIRREDYKESFVG